ncbi:MAG: recombination protein NinG, partial [Burkholderiales bacterium]|nr:recombination protein NinG [Burkholderiales bacterium]
VCSPACAIPYARNQSEKSQKMLAKAERMADRAKREKLKTRSDWMKDAQKQFNKYVRLRDRGLGCISCGSILVLERAIGGGYDCGHFRSVGSAPHLRFDPRNAAGQCKQCNRYGAGMVVEYRKGLINRHGVEFVESLESDQSSRKYTIEDLKQIRDTYRAKCKELEKA